MAAIASIQKLPWNAPGAALDQIFMNKAVRHRPTIGGAANAIATTRHGARNVG